MSKSGLNFFPLDVEMDTSVQLIEAEFGLAGFGVVVKLFQKIYGEQGYYLEWTYEVALLFSHKVGLGVNVVSEIVKTAINRGIFDKTLYDKYQILTSKGIQKRYFEAVSRRKDVEVDGRFLIISYNLLPNNVNILAENVNINSENVYISQQKKREESKRKEKRVDNNARACETLVSLGVEIDCAIPNDFDVQCLEKALSKSNYLRSWKFLSKYISKMDKISSGYYDDYNPEQRNNPKEVHQYTDSDYKNFFVN